MTLYSIKVIGLPLEGDKAINEISLTNSQPSINTFEGLEYARKVTILRNVDNLNLFKYRTLFYILSLIGGYPFDIHRISNFTKTNIKLILKFTTANRKFRTFTYSFKGDNEKILSQGLSSIEKESPLPKNLVDDNMEIRNKNILPDIFPTSPRIVYLNIDMFNITEKSDVFISQNKKLYENAIRYINEIFEEHGKSTYFKQLSIAIAAVFGYKIEDLTYNAENPKIYSKIIINRESFLDDLTTKQLSLFVLSCIIAISTFKNIVVIISNLDTLLVNDRLNIRKFMTLMIDEKKQKDFKSQFILTFSNDQQRRLALQNYDDYLKTNNLLNQFVYPKK